jgi:hypothetical protein
MSYGGPTLIFADQDAKALLFAQNGAKRALAFLRLEGCLNRGYPPP